MNNKDAFFAMNDAIVYCFFFLIDYLCMRIFLYQQAVMRKICLFYAQFNRL
jgi:hypothetical protein